MRIEFDPAEDASNSEKHGLSLALAVSSLRRANRRELKHYVESSEEDAD